MAQAQLAHGGCHHGGGRMAEIQSGSDSTRSLAMTITLNGEPFDVVGPLTIADLLARLDIDARRVAVEHNLIVLKRATYETTAVGEGDQIEIVNFVGGGSREV